jgi:diaminopimelate decarboxylase
VLLVRLLYKKRSGQKVFLITDGGMNDLIRPSLYSAFQNVFNCVRRDTIEVADVVGPICESGDFFAKDREITLSEQGDYLAVMSAGAYGMSMASRYNTRRLPAEVMVGADGTTRLIRRRESYDDIMAPELGL